MNDIILREMPNLPAEYRGMLDRIGSELPRIRAASENFYKSASQFKAATLDNTALTPIRSIKQILAEIDRTRMALEEAAIKARKNAIEIRRREAKLKNGIDEFDRELMEVEIEELAAQNRNLGNGVRGAIRKLSFQIGQYRQVLAFIGKDAITEDDYEREEARYHVMTAFKQALIAARAHGGRIDEGNHIYLFDLGVNGAEAQAQIDAYLNMERELLAQGKAMPHSATIEWLRSCADKYAPCPAAFAALRGLALRDEPSLIGGLHEPAA